MWKLQLVLLVSLVFSPFFCFAENGKPLLVAIISFDTKFLDADRGFRDGFSDKKYSDGKIRYVLYDLKQDLTKIPTIIKELRQQKCDLIMTITTPVVLAVKKAMGEINPIPVIFTMVGDPLASQVVSTLQNPGGYITGISYNAFAMMPKRLELFRKAFPEMKTIGIVYNHGFSWLATPIKDILHPAAEGLGFTVSQYDVRDQEQMNLLVKDFDGAVEGLFMVPDPLSIAFFDQLLELSRKEKLPIMVQDNILLQKGGVLGYSPSFYSVGKQAAAMAEKVFSGTRPARLAVQNPYEIQLIVSLKETEKLGLHLSDAFLSDADIIVR